MTTIAKGANIPIDVPRVRAALSWTPGPRVPDIDGSALVLRDTGHVASDDDFVFFNQPAHPSGALRHVGKQGGTDTVEVDLGSLAADIERVALAASADGGTFGQVPGLRLVLSDAASGASLAEFAIDATEETAMVSGELYRRDGRWKFRAVGQGYAAGLAGLATDFGISVDETPEPLVPVPAPAVVNLDKGRVNLVKGSRVSLVKSGAPPLQKVTMGLGWDPASGRKAIDLDASAIAFDATGTKLAMVWFTKLKEFKGALQHAGDNLTGQGDGDDEKIHVDLAALPREVTSLVFTITSFRGQKFTEVANAFCRLVDAGSDTELVRYNLSEAEPSSAVIMAMLRRTDPTSSVWQMHAIGEFHDAKTVKSLVDPSSRHAIAP